MNTILKGILAGLLIGYSVLAMATVEVFMNYTDQNQFTNPIHCLVTSTITYGDNILSIECTDLIFASTFETD